MTIQESFSKIEKYTIICAFCKNQITHDEKTINYNSKYHHVSCWLNNSKTSHKTTHYKIPFTGDITDETQHLFRTISILDQKLKDMYENSKNLCCTIDINQKIIECNKTFAVSLGFSREELDDISFFDLIDKRYHEHFNMILKMHDGEKDIFEQDILMKRKNGDSFPGLLNMYTVRNENEERNQFLIMIQDITEIHKARNEIRHNENIIREQLEQLQKLDSMKDEFLTTITHELKTPLVPIKAYTDILLLQHLGPLNARQQKGLEIINNNTNVLLKLIEDLLDVQKLELGIFKLDIERNNLTEIVQDVIVHVRTSVNISQIIISSDIQPDIYCLCDKKRIERVLTNLLDNSLEFCSKKSGVIHIKLDHTNEHARITIKDNGSGISKENINKLFVKFYQVDTSNTRKHGGTGLGLSICKGIVENHGGRIYVESDGIDRGIKVTIFLRLDQ